MIGYRSCVYNKEGKAKIVETIEARDEHYASGEWFDSPKAAKEALDNDIAATQKKLDENKVEQDRLHKNKGNKK